MSGIFQAHLWLWTLKYYNIFVSSSVASCVVSSTDASDFQYGEGPSTSMYQFGIFLRIQSFGFFGLQAVGSPGKNPILFRIQCSVAWCWSIMYSFSRRFMMDENRKESIPQSHMDMCILPNIIPFQTKQGLAKDVLAPRNIIFKR